MGRHVNGHEWRPREPAMAFLLHDEHIRAVCLGCSSVLFDKGMLVIIKEMPLSERQPEFSTVIYGIADGYTLADCRAAIQDRHIGQPWGA
jgi:hypothetical protein